MRKRLTIIGNGFDLAHRMKTSYNDFIFWFFRTSVAKYAEENRYNDPLISIKQTKDVYGRMSRGNTYTSLKEMVEHLSYYGRTISYNSEFFKRIVDMSNSKGWVDIESYYFRYLKSIFLSHSLGNEVRQSRIKDLNACFDYIIEKLAEYIEGINRELTAEGIGIENPRLNIRKAFVQDSSSPVLFVNFNYTDTLIQKGYSNEDECLFIHGRVADQNNNPIIFGYGDESDPDYQKIEDSGDNDYLEHIKSFGYFRADNYQKLLTFIDSGAFDVFIVGHSCGLSDRILLNEIFEHRNCEEIHVFYHRREDGTDNFKQITQDISRHFRPANKNLMRRRVQPKDVKNVIPQNSKS